MAAQPQAIGADEDLDALFDSVAENRVREPRQVGDPNRRPCNDAGLAAPPQAVGGENVHQRLGQLTRLLHDTLSELGYDKTVTALVQGLPDARDRLNYIARLTGQAAEKALNGVDKGQEIQAGIGAGAKALAAEWKRLFAGGATLEQFGDVAQRTRDYLDAVPGRTDELGAVLTDIMMAQDFHDLTGQVIKKIVDLAKYTEKQLVEILLETTPPEMRAGMEHHLAGPVINPQGRSDVVTDQQQVDDLLDKLGF